MAIILLSEFFAAGIFDGLTGVSDALFAVMNGISGRSWILDTLLALPVYHPLAAFALLGSCFVFIWRGGDDDRAFTLKRRRILLITVVSSILAVAAVGSMSQSIFPPPPFVRSQVTYLLNGDQAVRGTSVKPRVPLDDKSQNLHKALTKGDISRTELDSFPSDLAALYSVFAIGIFLASRRIGMFALGWTIVMVFATRIAFGVNAPLEIAGGSVIGTGIFALIYFLSTYYGRRLFDSLAEWTLDHPAAATAAIFVFLFDAMTMFANFRLLIAVGLEIGRISIRG